MTLLTSTRNKYGGVYIHPGQLPDQAHEFEERLSASLKQWRRDGIAAVWLSLGEGTSNLTQAARDRGFEFHHCTASELMLVRRLTPEAPLPSFATHTIGAGGLVLSDTNEILTVVERQDLTRRPNHLKFPGGMLEPGEHIAAGVVREVFEETGIETEFESIVGFRHHHGGQFGTSNIYFVCALRPLTFDITIDESEIGRALWMPVEGMKYIPRRLDTAMILLSRRLRRSVTQPAAPRLGLAAVVTPFVLAVTLCGTSARYGGS